jgi:mono/diheme cytochrome c family protein
MSAVRRASAALAVLVLVGTVLVVAGAGQGAPPHQLPISAAAKRREIAAVRSGETEVQVGKRLFSAHGCANCHTMSAGNHDGRLGPRVDVQAQGKTGGGH